MFATTDIEEIFPSCLWMHEVADCGPLNDGLSEAIRALQAEGAGHKRSDGGGWTSKADLLERDAFMPLSEYLVKAAEGVLYFLQFEYEHFYISECWANLNLEGDAHPRHNHPNSILSGVYYARAPKSCGDITFYDPRPQATIIHPAAKETTTYNAHRHVVQPREGLLIVFPSWLEHGVDPNASGADRLSFSFNVMLTGEIGYETGKFIV